MPARILPTFAPAQVASKNTEESCYVTLGKKVYDVTEFLDSHPGGADLIIEWGGKDVTEILKDEASHQHSAAAYEILDDDCFVGFLGTDDTKGKTTGFTDPRDAIDENGKTAYDRTGMTSAADLSKDTDLTEDYKKHKFLDLNKPLLPQMWFGGFEKKFYLEQVHRPRHYKGGDSAPLFGNFLEPLSKTPWYVVPIVWFPPVFYGLFITYQQYGLGTMAACWAFGLFLWTLIEYIMHRFLFHLDKFLPNNRVALTMHFLLHGVHHYLPMDKLRLVMPPALFLILATPFWKLAHAVFYWDWYLATGVFCGGIFGYICYDMTHYFLHHKNIPGYYKQLKKYHLEHHFMDYENGFGVTSRLWDVVFGTELKYTTKPLKAS